MAVGHRGADVAAGSPSPTVTLRLVKGSNTARWSIRWCAIRSQSAALTASVTKTSCCLSSSALAAPLAVPPVLVGSKNPLAFYKITDPNF